jgi:hypothetical protein
VSKPTNAEVDAHILASLPATFMQLHMAKGDGWYRPVDSRLQALRRRGLITYRREGRNVIWQRVDGAA